MSVISKLGGRRPGLHVLDGYVHARLREAGPEGRRLYDYNKCLSRGMSGGSEAAGRH